MTKIKLLLQNFAICFLLSQCTHFIIRDKTKYGLEPGELQAFQKNKFALIGFYPFQYSIKSKRIVETNEPQFPCSYYDTLQSFDRNLAVYHCIVGFLSNGNKELYPHLYKKLNMEIYPSKHSPGYLIPASIDYSESTASYFPAENEIRKVRQYSKQGDISEEKLKEFLLTYITTVRHAGLKELESILDIEYSIEDCECEKERKTIQRIKSIKLKKIDTDYWIIADHRQLYTGILDGGINNRKANLKGLTFLPALFTLGIIPYWDEAAFESKFLIYDKSMNLINTLTYVQRYDHITGIWLISKQGFLTISEGPFGQNQKSSFLYESSVKKMAKDIYLWSAR
jgi:hypothetical protein